MSFVRFIVFHCVYCVCIAFIAFAFISYCFIEFILFFSILHCCLFCDLQYNFIYFNRTPTKIFHLFSHFAFILLCLFHYFINYGHYFYFYFSCLFVRLYFYISVFFSSGFCSYFYIRI